MSASTPNTEVITQSRQNRRNSQLRRTTALSAFNRKVTFHLTYQTQATRRESVAILNAIPEARENKDHEVQGSAYVMSQLLPITASIDFNFEGDDAPIEVLSLQDFWLEAQHCADDHAAVWGLWQELSTEASLIWWDKHEARAGALRADPALQMTDEEAKATGDPN